MANTSTIPYIKQRKKGFCNLENSKSDNSDNTLNKTNLPSSGLTMKSQYKK